VKYSKTENVVILLGLILEIM